MKVPTSGIKILFGKRLKPSPEPVFLDNHFSPVNCHIRFVKNKVCRLCGEKIAVDIAGASMPEFYDQESRSCEFFPQAILLNLMRNIECDDLCLI